MDTTPSNDQVNAKLLSYEDCIKLIDTQLTSDNVTDIKAALTRIRSFLNDRVGKRSREKSEDGGEAVKKALLAGRTYKPFTPKADAAPAPSSHAWS